MTELADGKPSFAAKAVVDNTIKKKNNAICVLRACILGCSLVMSSGFASLELVLCPAIRAAYLSSLR
jgi:hypothetical protein